MLAISRRYADLEALQCKALGVLGSLALCTDVQRVIANEGGVDVALAAMSAHALSASVQCRGCKVLCNLAFEDASVQVRIAESGGAQAIVRAMDALLSNAQVQAEGCAALCNLGANSCEAVAQTLAHSGALAAVVKAMAMHGASQDVQFKVSCTACVVSCEDRRKSCRPVLSCLRLDGFSVCLCMPIEILCLSMHALCLCSLCMHAYGQTGAGRNVARITCTFICA